MCLMRWFSFPVHKGWAPLLPQSPALFPIPRHSFRFCCLSPHDEGRA